jgi:hypothetical protein
MKLAIWILLIAALGLLCGWIVIGSWSPHGQLDMLLVAILFTSPNIGAVWMMFIAIRHESKPIPFVALALIPFSFLWYYAERYRTGRYLNRSSKDEAPLAQ